MSSKYYEATVTLTVDGDEKDVSARAFVDVAPGLGMGGSWGAELDGDADLFIGGAWCPIDSVAIGDGDIDRVSEALCDAALDDDGL